MKCPNCGEEMALQDTVWTCGGCGCSMPAKRMLSFSLSLLIVLMMIPLGVFSASASTSGTTGGCTWMRDDAGNLTISGNGAMGDDFSPWDSSGRSITSVTICNGVTSIGSCAFDERDHSRLRDLNWQGGILRLHESDERDHRQRRDEHRRLGVFRLHESDEHRCRPDKSFLS